MPDKQHVTITRNHIVQKLLSFKTKIWIYFSLFFKDFKWHNILAWQPKSHSFSSSTVTYIGAGIVDGRVLFTVYSKKVSAILKKHFWKVKGVTTMYYSINS